ncbi:hypothetical protein PBY51_004663 [Eleginops maclovinus]|uniref:Uncharacterized protein n=1 Tax=Eleginops maclovinus TaxID=56733 RepID=A0AAN7Y4J9_ELEMC|nr:hypothetical protein PBY51_004663 [Eleginops maclovinus]
MHTGYVTAGYVTLGTVHFTPARWYCQGYCQLGCHTGYFSSTGVLLAWYCSCGTQHWVFARGTSHLYVPLGYFQQLGYCSMWYVKLWNVSAGVCHGGRPRVRSRGLSHVDCSTGVRSWGTVTREGPAVVAGTHVVCPGYCTAGRQLVLSSWYCQLVRSSLVRSGDGHTGYALGYSPWGRRLGTSQRGTHGGTVAAVVLHFGCTLWYCQPGGLYSLVLRGYVKLCGGSAPTYGVRGPPRRKKKSFVNPALCSTKPQHQTETTYWPKNTRNTHPTDPEHQKHQLWTQTKHHPGPQTQEHSSTPKHQEHEHGPNKREHSVYGDPQNTGNTHLLDPKHRNTRLGPKPGTEATDPNPGNTHYCPRNQTPVYGPKTPNTSTGPKQKV